jgi:Fanconi anemia group M protein
MRPTKARRSSGGHRTKSNNENGSSVAALNGEGPRRRDWFPSAGEMVTLVADAAQKGNAILESLAEKKVRLVYANMQIGDYQITDNVYITYMTSDAFIRGIADKRLYRQILELKRAVPEPVLLVEGPDVYEHKGANAYQINGALAFITVLNRIPVIFTSDAEESADILFMATNQMQFGLGYDVHPEDQKARKRQFKEIQQDVLTALPGIGPAVAKTLIKKHKSLKDIFALDAEQLTDSGLEEQQPEVLGELFEFKG